MIEISNLLQRNAPALKESIERTESLRRSHPSVRVAESIYTQEDRMSIYSAADSVMADSEMEFDFDDIIVNSAAYRRALAAAKYQQQPAVPPTVEVEGDLIDFSDSATLKQVPPRNEGGGIAAISEDLLDLTFVTNVRVGAWGWTGAKQGLTYQTDGRAELRRRCRGPAAADR